MSREKRICMAYWMNAMRLPTCISPRSMRWAPNQMMATVGEVHQEHHRGHHERHELVHPDGDVREVEVGLVEAARFVLARG